MPQTTKSTRLDFCSNVAATAKSGLTFMRDGLSVANDFADLFAADLTSEDYAGTALEGFDPKDVMTLVGALQSIDAVLSANEGAVRKAVKRLAQYAR